MWMFTGGLTSEKPSFSSAVRHRDDPNMLVVRTRDEISARQLADATGGKIVQKNYSDYPFRVFMTKDQYKAYFCAQVDALEYTNFKGHVSSKLTGTAKTKWSSALHDVWGAMIKIAPRQPYSAIDGSRRTFVSDRPRQATGQLRGRDGVSLRKYSWDDVDEDDWSDLVPSLEDEDALLLEDLRAEEARLLRLRDRGELDWDDVHDQLTVIEETKLAATRRRRRV